MLQIGTNEMAERLYDAHHAAQLRVGLKFTEPPTHYQWRNLTNDERLVWRSVAEAASQAINDAMSGAML